jgi:RNA polymerase-interacting CarD/CdnL/TRCF family regulator
MATSTPLYALGDLVVHRSYGIGKIEGIERKPINGEKRDCFRVKTENSVFWFPTDAMENPRVHPLASLALIEEAILILQSEPKEFTDDPHHWKERIDEVQDYGGFLDITKLIRDLAGLKKNKVLNRTQDQALTILEKRLLREWAARLDVDIDSIRPKLEAYLKGTY